nr:MAG TPA: hypothetical protein [Caudoviricetes sp.]
MNTIKYRFKQIQKLGKLFGETYVADKWISGNTKYGSIAFSKTNYNQEVDVYISYHKGDNILYIKNNIFREGKLVCRFIDYPLIDFTKIKMYNKPLFNKYKNNILLWNGVLKNNTVYFAH